MAVTPAEITKIIQEIDVGRPGWSFSVEVCSPHTLLNLTFVRPDRETGKMGIGAARPWILNGTTAVEIIQTALGMVLAVEEHEARERFKYQGHRVFDPHRISF